MTAKSASLVLAVAMVLGLGYMWLTISPGSSEESSTCAAWLETLKADWTRKYAVDPETNIYGHADGTEFDTPEEVERFRVDLTAPRAAGCYDELDEWDSFVMAPVSPVSV